MEGCLHHLFIHEGEHHVGKYAGWLYQVCAGELP